MYNVAEVNYFLWGLVNRLAYEDGIQTSKTNNDTMIAAILGYRAGFGGLVIADQHYKSLRGDDVPPEYETISGKVDWASYGWQWATELNPQLPLDASLPNVIPNQVGWSGVLTWHAGEKLSGIVQ